MRHLRAWATALWVAAATGAAAQQSYVQIEAHPTLAETVERARAYGGLFPNINGFALSGRWYGLALGPYATPDAAAAELRRLQVQGLIPGDSYVTEADAYNDRVWPAGADAAVPAPAVPERIAPADETPQEARRSERLLARSEREDLQRALRWFGHYGGRIDGAFGRGTRASMADWQASAGFEATGVLTTRQRAELLADWRAAQAALGLEPIRVDEAGVALTAPMGLVRFDRIEAPFVHYAPRGDSGVTLSLISQRGDRATLGGLYELLQTLDIVPTQGERARNPTGFRIRGEGPERTTEVVARLDGDHILGFLLSWPPDRARDAARAVEAMEATLASSGAPLDPEAGFESETQSLDTVSGLAVRQPLRAASGFFVDGDGAVVTAARTVAGCGRVTLDRRFEAEAVAQADGAAVLRPAEPLTPARVAALAPQEGRLRSEVAVGGYPFGGVLGAPTLTYGTLEDVRGLDGSDRVLRLSLAAQAGDAGGPVLDAAGRVAGMLLPAPGAEGRALPADVTLAVKARALDALLDRAGIVALTAPDGAALPPERLSERAAEMTVLVSCWE